MSVSLSRPEPDATVAFARNTRPKILPMLGGLIVAIYILAPFCWLLLTSFMHEQDALSVPPQWIPKNPTLSNYMTFLDPTGTRAIVGSRAAEQTFPGMVNSLIAATGTAVLNLVLGTLAGYSLARFRFRGRGSLLGVYLGSRMLPGIALIVPLYLTIKNFGLLDHLRLERPSLKAYGDLSLRLRRTKQPDSAESQTHTGVTRCSEKIAARHRVR